jgi:hypothetical protein
MTWDTRTWQENERNSMKNGDQLGDNTTKIKQNQSTRQAINALNSIWWHKIITKSTKLYIYQTIIQSIFMHGAEVWQMRSRVH